MMNIHSDKPNINFFNESSTFSLLNEDFMEINKNDGIVTFLIIT